MQLAILKCSQRFKLGLPYSSIHGVTEKQIQRVSRAGLLSGPDIRILGPALKPLGQATSHHGAYVVVQFYPWFKFRFRLFQTDHHTLPYPKTKKN